MPRGIPNKPREPKTNFAPPATPAEAIALAPDRVIDMTNALVVDAPELTLEQREAELAVMINEIAAERVEFEADKASFEAYVVAFQRGLADIELPKTITLNEDFGFMENGTLRHWQAGKAVTNPADIVTLFAKQAHIEGFDHV